MAGSVDYLGLINRGDLAAAAEKKGGAVHPAIAFALSLGLLALAGRQLAAAARALGMPATVVALLESLALG
jgi:hypothetical protein